MYRFILHIKNILILLILEEERYDEKCDVYSFGILLWEIVHMKIPYSEIKAFEFEKKIGTEGYRPQIESSISSKIQNMIQLCWNQDSNKRHSFSQILELNI